MKKFEFRLGSALRLYEAKLDLEKQKLTQLLAQEEQILRSIANRTEEMRRQNDAMRELVDLRSTDLRALSTYNLSAQTHMVALHEELAHVRRSIHLQRQAVIREERAAKLVLKLKEKKRAQWQQVVNRQLDLDAEEIWLAVNRIKQT